MNLRKLLVILTIITTVFASPGLLLAAEEFTASVPADTSSLSSLTQLIEAPSPVILESPLPLAEPVALPEVGVIAPQPFDPLPADPIQENLNANQAEAVNLEDGPLRDDAEMSSSYLPEKSSNHGNKGSNVSIDQFSGSASFGVGINIPAGRNGVQPNIYLSYNSQNTSNQSLVGYGWKLSIPAIERVNKSGVNALYDNNYFSSSLSGELVPVETDENGYGTYGAKVETGDYLEYIFNENNSWTVKDKSGSVYTFGETTDSRQDDPSDERRIFKWNLSEIRDTNDNFLTYFYYKNEGQIYPQNINYTANGQEAGIFDVEFVRADRNDNQVFYQTGFAVKTNQRISQILIKQSGEWFKKYELNYATGDNGRRSLLAGVTESAKDAEGDVSSLPAQEFTYSDGTLEWQLEEGLEVPEAFAVYNRQDRLSNPGNLIDLNGDGLMDIQNRFESYFKTTTGWEMVEVEAPYHQNDGGARYAEVNGDGSIDIVRSRTYLNNGDGLSWNEAEFTRPISFVATGGYYDRGARMADVNGDGLDDIVCSSVTTMLDRNNRPYGDEYGCNAVYLNNGNDTGWTLVESYEVPQPFIKVYRAGAESWVWADEGARMADVNGDGLLDILYGREGNDRKVYLNNGLNWVEDENWQLPVDFSHEAYYEGNNGVEIIDVNGDNLPDLVWANENDDVKFYLNKGDGTGWVESEDYEMPDIDDNGNGPVRFNKIGDDRDSGVRLADINGDGAPDILWSLSRDFGGQFGPQINNKIYLSQAVKSDYLISTSNGYGATTQLEYQSSQQYLNNEGELLNPKLGSAIQTIKRMTVNDGFGTQTEIEYSYQDGEFYYQATAPKIYQFAGFGKVEKIIEDHKEVYYFHQGNQTNEQLGETLDSYYKMGKVYRTEEYQIFEAEDILLKQNIVFWQQDDLGHSRKFVRQEVALDYTFTDQEQQQRVMALGNFNNQADHGNVALIMANQSVANAQPQFAPEISSELVKQYYLGKNELGNNIFRAEIIPQPLRDENGEFIDNTSDAYFLKNVPENEAFIDVIDDANAQLQTNNDRLMMRANPLVLTRPFFLFDTSDLPDDAQATDLVFNFTTTERWGYSLDAGVYNFLPDNPANPSSDDFNNFSQEQVAVFSSDHPVHENPRYHVTLDETAHDWIDPTGFTGLMLRSSYDYNGQNPQNSHEYNIWASEIAEEEWRPSLTIIYTSDYDPLAPTSLKVNNQTEPYDLTNDQLIFSSVYQNMQEEERAISYQIQVVSSQGNFNNPLWDSEELEINNPLAVGQRSEQFNHSADLPELNGYYWWRMKYFNDGDPETAEGYWSEPALFRVYLEENLADHIRVKAIEYNYDLTTGNLVSERSLGEVEATLNGSYQNQNGDEKTSAYQYAQPLNDTVRILAAPTEKIITNPNTDESSTVSIFYDGRNDNLVAKANPTKEDLNIAQTVYQKTFNNYGLVTSTIDPLNHRTTVIYDNNNYYPVTTRNHLNQTTRTEYDLATGQINKITDPNGVVEERDYDAFGRLTEVRKTNPASTNLLVMQRYQYNDTDSPAWVKQIDYPGQSFELSGYSYFDGLGRTIQFREQTGNGNNYTVVSYEYNNKGNLARQTLPYIAQNPAYQQPDWNTPHNLYTYDAQNRVLSETFHSATQDWFTSYAYDGWNVTIVDSNGNLKKLYKDAYGQLIQVDEYLNDEVYSSKYEYNLLGKLIKITDSQGNTRNFSYDSLGRLTSQEEMHRANAQEYGVWSYEYDQASNLIRKTDPKGQETNYTYDTLNRILTENDVSREGVEVSYTYDSGTYGKGRLYRVVSQGATTSYTYDKWGRVTKEAKTIANLYYQTQWAYNLQSVPTSITYPDNSKVYYSYNKEGLPIRLRTANPDQNIVTSMALIDNVIYSPLKQITRIDYTNGTVSENTFDPAQAYRLTHKSTINRFNDVLQDLTYVYDAVGNITQLVDRSQTQLAKTTNYEYDSLYRLTRTEVTNSANNADYQQTYTYDVIGNILNKSDIGEYLYQNVNPYQTNSVNNVAYTYDVNGNLTSDEAKTYHYNYADRLVQVDLAEDNVLYNQYDQSGQRTVKELHRTIPNTLGGENIYLTKNVYPNSLYEEELSGLEEDEQNWQTKKTRHITLGNQTIAHVDVNAQGVSEKILVFSDHLGSSSLLTDSMGRVKTLYDYYPFGGTRLDSSDGLHVSAYQYTGKELDEETGLNYFGARYQNADIGRFTQVDPVAFNLSMVYLYDPQQLNYYSYTRNNPLIFVDPNGEKVYTAAKAIEAKESGTHVFIHIVPDNPEDFGLQEGKGWVIGAYGDNGFLEKAKDAPSDDSVIKNGYSNPDQEIGALKEKVEVPTPDGKTDTEFINEIMAQYDAYKNDAAYDPFSVNGYNSNNFITMLLKNSGVQILPWNGNAPGIDPGYGDTIPNNYKKFNGQSSAPIGLGQTLSVAGSYGSKRLGKNLGEKIKETTNSVINGSKALWGWLKEKAS